MPKRVPVKSIVLFRDGKQVRPTIGKEFDFTAEELKDINDLSPKSVRKVIVEDAESAETLAAAEAAREQAEKDAKKNAGRGNPGAAATTSAVAGGKKAGAGSAADL